MPKLTLESGRKATFIICLITILSPAFSQSKGSKGKSLANPPKGKGEQESPTEVLPKACRIYATSFETFRKIGDKSYENTIRELNHDGTEVLNTWDIEGTGPINGIAAAAGQKLMMTTFMSNQPLQNIILKSDGKGSRTSIPGSNGVSTDSGDFLDGKFIATLGTGGYKLRTFLNGNIEELNTHATFTNTAPIVLGAILDVAVLKNEDGSTKQDSVGVPYVISVESYGQQGSYINRINLFNTPDEGVEILKQTPNRLTGIASLGGDEVIAVNEAAQFYGFNPLDTNSNLELVKDYDWPGRVFDLASTPCVEPPAQPSLQCGKLFAVEWKNSPFKVLIHELKTSNFEINSSWEVKRENNQAISPMIFGLAVNSKKLYGVGREGWAPISIQGGTNLALMSENKLPGNDGGRMLNEEELVHLKNFSTQAGQTTEVVKIDTSSASVTTLFNFFHGSFGQVTKDVEFFDGHYWFVANPWSTANGTGTNNSILLRSAGGTPDLMNQYDHDFTGLAYINDSNGKIVALSRQGKIFQLDPNSYTATEVKNLGQAGSTWFDLAYFPCGE